MSYDLGSVPSTVRNIGHCKLGTGAVCVKCNGRLVHARRYRLRIAQLSTQPAPSFFYFHIRCSQRGTP
jgi:hypothetical protein